MRKSARGAARELGFGGDGGYSHGGRNRRGGLALGCRTVERKVTRRRWPRPSLKSLQLRQSSEQPSQLQLVPCRGHREGGRGWGRWKVTEAEVREAAGA